MDIEDALQRLETAQGDPEELALVTIDVVLSLYTPELRTALEAAAVPHWFDAKVLSALSETDEATANTWVEELSRLPMVETFAAREGWNVHEATRLALRNRMAGEASPRFPALSLRAAQYFESDDPAWHVESMYHQLLAAPQEAADQLEQLWKEWDDAGRHEWLQALGVALDELIRTDQLAPPTRARSLLCLGRLRRSTLPPRKAEELAQEALALFRELQHKPGQAHAHCQLGDVLVGAGNLAEALREYEAYKTIMEQLTARDPENTHWQRELSVSHNRVRGVYEAQGRLAEYEAGLAIAERLTAHDSDLPMKRVLLVDDHAVVRKGLKQILEEAVVDLEIAEASDGTEAILMIQQGSWDAVILDISLLGMNGLDVLKRIRANWKKLPILVLSMHPEEQYGIRVLRAGASGYLTKPCAPEKLVDALELILGWSRYVSPTLAEKLVLELDNEVRDEPHHALTDREYQVLRMIASGKTVSAIAGELSLSAKTISTHRSRILAKMHMKNSAELTHYAITKGLVD